MGKSQGADNDINNWRSRPARTPEERENRLIALTYDLVESKIRDGTATSQETTHFLKLGTVKNQLEIEKLRTEQQLLEAKKHSIESAERSEELYNKAIEALKRYKGES